MSKRPLAVRKRLATTMLTLLAALGSTAAIAGCGGKSSSESEKAETTTSHSSGLHKKQVEKKAGY